jgi:hypothetical protein
LSSLTKNSLRIEPQLALFVLLVFKAPLTIKVVVNLIINPPLKGLIYPRQTIQRGTTEISE